VIQRINNILAAVEVTMKTDLCPLKREDKRTGNLISIDNLQINSICTATTVDLILEL